MEKPSNSFAEFIDQDDIIRNFAHDIDLKSVVSPLQAILCHLARTLSLSVQPPAKGDHYDEIVQSHLFSNPFHRLALQSKPLPVSFIIVPRGTTKT